MSSEAAEQSPTEAVDLADIETRLDDLLDQYDRLRRDNRRLLLEQKALNNRNEDLRRRIQSILDRIKGLEGQEL